MSTGRLIFELETGERLEATLLHETRQVTALRIAAPADRVLVALAVLRAALDVATDEVVETLEAQVKIEKS